MNRIIFKDKRNKIKRRLAVSDSAGAVSLGAWLAKLADAFEIILTLVNRGGLQIGGRVLAADTEFSHRLVGTLVVFLAVRAETMNAMSGKRH